MSVQTTVDVPQLLEVPVESPQVQFLDKFGTPVLPLFFDTVVDVPVVLCNGVLRVQKTVEMIQLVSQERIQERITEQGVDVPLPHIMEEMMEVERNTWQNRYVLRGCAGVDFVWHTFHFAQILRTQAIRSHVSSRSVETESIHGSLAFFRIFRILVFFLSLKSSKTPR